MARGSIHRRDKGRKLLRNSSKHQGREKLRKEHTADKSPSNHPEGEEYFTKEVIHADMGDTPVGHKQKKTYSGVNISYKPRSSNSSQSSGISRGKDVSPTKVGEVSPTTTAGKEEYIQVQKSLSRMNSEMVGVHDLKRVVRKEIFPRKKFILSDLDLDVHSSIARKIFEIMRVDDQDMADIASWWEKRKRVVCQTIDSCRSVCNHAFRTSFISKCFQKKEVCMSFLKSNTFHVETGLGENDMLPKLEEILCLRRDPKVFYVFCDNFLSWVCGRNLWKKRWTVETVSQIATVSDEAFALLLLENSWKKWTAEGRNEEDGEDENSVDTEGNQTRWTKNGRSAVMYKGWSREGIERFNELYSIVMEDRKTERGKKVEAEYRDARNEEYGQPKKRKLEKGYIGLTCEDDFSDDDLGYSSPAKRRNSHDEERSSMSSNSRTGGNFYEL